MDTFKLREQLVADYGQLIGSYINIADPEIAQRVDAHLADELLPKPLVQLNPRYEVGARVDELVTQGLLHPKCSAVFSTPSGQPFELYRHQVQAIERARQGGSYVVTTGTGSGKSLAYIIPIVDLILREGTGRGVRAVVVYPMNALANSQLNELKKFLREEDQPSVRFARYTGQESEDERRQIVDNPPDILLTNYVMLELLLTRPHERPLLSQANQLAFLVLDELHTYRGRQGADVALLTRRVKDASGCDQVQCVGTSATMADADSWVAQQTTIAEVASAVFGQRVDPSDVIGETLERTTPPLNLEEPTNRALLTARVGAQPPQDVAAFLGDPLARWLEGALGVYRSAEGRLERRVPRCIEGPAGAAAELARQTGHDAQNCEAAIRATLLQGHRLTDQRGRSLLAFRLHQFLAKGETVYASPEPPGQRHISLSGQQFVPGEGRRRVLLPLAFCRECGHAYYTVRRERDATHQEIFVPRGLSDRDDGDRVGRPGFLTFEATGSLWPDDDPEALAEHVPPDWLEPDREPARIRSDKRKLLPERLCVTPDGRKGSTAVSALWLPRPFRFCINCGVSYSGRVGSDFGTLGTLGTEGRSSATTILALRAVRELQADSSLQHSARKLLSFSDSRQDAALQSGHFNDFIAVTLTRAGLWRAARDAGPQGLSADDLTTAVQQALQLPAAAFALNPDARFRQRDEAVRALKATLGHRLYRDLQRGWRLTAPNLEQCGLLRIDYVSLGELCRAEDIWGPLHPALASASPIGREQAARVLLDGLRRELCIGVRHLEPAQRDRLQDLGEQYLQPTWRVDQEDFEQARHALLRSRRPRDPRYYSFLSARSRIGIYLRRHLTDAGRLSLADTPAVIDGMLRALNQADLVRATTLRGGESGWQLVAAGMRWVAEDGVAVRPDPLRMSRPPRTGLTPNPYFTQVYRSSVATIAGVEGRAHTAQVQSEVRQAREEAFREGNLAVLFCSPTMELGVDIADLNVVNLRNVPPTPANYAQRSGRAGRSGQPALVYTYCSSGSPHDRHYFRHPEQMVAGAVSAPRLDLTNEALIESHVYAIWLAEARLPLGTHLGEVLDLNDQPGRLPLRPNVEIALASPHHRRRAMARAETTLGPVIAAQLIGDDTVQAWLTRAFDQIRARFDRACERWRDLYLAASSQRDQQHERVKAAHIGEQDRKTAKRLRGEAERQIDELTRGGGRFQGDFYSYRYFAAEGFLPGYNFPRLPLAAWIPGRRGDRDEVISRPRFLAVSEFGPQSIIYHEGARFIVNRVLLEADERRGSLTQSGALCMACGYIHPADDAHLPDVCEQCETPLAAEGAMPNLFRMRSVSTRRRERINCDEEERQRMGYEVRTAVRFARRNNRPDVRSAEVRVGTHVVARLRYGRAAHIWRINLGWRRRKESAVLGFDLDMDRGFWAKKRQPGDTRAGHADPVTPNIQRVVPFVDDHRNALVFEPVRPLDADALTTLQEALKAAIQQRYQLEDRELEAEPLPHGGDRRQILFYESAEGGAGVLRQLVESATAFPELMRLALARCHFDPARDFADAGGALEEPCDAACYDCLLSYYNQRDHRRLDRHHLLALIPWTTAQVEVSPTPLTRAEQHAALSARCDSQLERAWLMQVYERGLRLPDYAQKPVPAAECTPDFLYRDPATAIFIDGPHHDRPEQKATDERQHDALWDVGIEPVVFRFDTQPRWAPQLDDQPHIFGEAVTEPAPATPAPAPGFEPDLFAEAWVGVLAPLAGAGWAVEPGGDVRDRRGRVKGRTVAETTPPGAATPVHLVDTAHPQAESAEAALRARHVCVVCLQHDDPNAAQRLLAATQEAPE